MQFQQDRDFENLAFAFGENNAPLATLKTRGNWAELTFAMTSGTVTSVASPVTIPEKIATCIFESILRLVCKVVYWLSAQHCVMWDDVSRISNDAKLFLHGPVYGLASLRAVLSCHATLRQKRLRGRLATSLFVVYFHSFFASLCSFVFGLAEGSENDPGL